MQTGTNKRNRSWMISAGLIVAVGIWVISGQFGSDTPEQAAATPQQGSIGKNSVRVRTQSAEQIMRTITVNGKTAPARIARIAAETAGRVEYTGAERGANLERGDVIVRLDKRDRMARLEQAKAVVKQRELEYEGRKSLKTGSYVSEAQLQEAIALLEAARSELKRSELDLGYMTIRAPFAGALQDRSVEIGDFVSPGDPVAVYVDNRAIVVAASISEYDARYVEVGTKAEARLATGETVRGKIRYVAPVADQSTRTFAVELEVDNASGALRAGGTAELKIPAEQVLAHRVSPSLLTLDDAGNVGIKIVNEADEVQFVAADIALSSSDGVWLSGLPETATIITVGQGYVADGSLVVAVPEEDADTAVATKTDGQASGQ